MHSFEYGYCPVSFINTWQKNFQRNANMNLRNANDFHIPTANIEIFKKMPLFSLPLEWNLLTDELKFQFNQFTFKKALKDFLENLEAELFRSSIIDYLLFIIAFTLHLYDAL